MAMMINCAQDWTYDLYKEDAEKYKATPRKGVYPSSNADYREYFMVTLKGYVRDFIQSWEAEVGEGHRYDNRKGWIGDAFKKELDKFYFSDFYKEAYGQRPHLSPWFYITLLGLPMSEDTGRTFCASPIENAVELARRVREEE